MSLLDDYARTCTLLEKKRTMSDEGGWKTEWVDGLVFQNHYTLDTSMEALIAEKQGVTSMYSALVEKTFPIEFNDYFRDDTTGYTFRVTSNPEEKETPSMSTMDYKFFTAERRALPT